MPDISPTSASSSKFPSQGCGQISEARYHLHWIDVTFILKPEFPSEFRRAGSQNGNFIRDHTNMPFFKPLNLKIFERAWNKAINNSWGRSRKCKVQASHDSPLPQLGQIASATVLLQPVTARGTSRGERFRKTPRKPKRNK